MGQPCLWKHKQPASEKLACVELTEGTETSKYLQEKKSIEILLVAASERKIAQTSMRACWGCRTCIKAKLLEESSGKANQRE